MKNNYPKYVWMVFENHKVALELTKDGERYWRAAGHWDCKFVEMKDGTLISKCKGTNAHKRELVACTEKEWREDNKGYV